MFSIAVFKLQRGLLGGASYPSHVGQSVGQSVCRSVGRSVGLSVCLQKFLKILFHGLLNLTSHVGRLVGQSVGCLSSKAFENLVSWIIELVMSVRRSVFKSF